MLRRARAALRWRKLLASCDFDPGTVEAPLAEPTDRDFIVAGCPRTGTSLLAGLLFQPPEVVTVMEPWDGLRIPPAELFSSLRGELAETGHLSRGRLDTHALEEGRVSWVKDGTLTTQITVTAGYQLGVKWPAFWRYLDLLPNTRFLITVRHPIEVLNSFERVGGRLSKGYDYPVAFHAEMNRQLRAATSDVRERRVLLYEYVNTRILPHLRRPNVMAVRYERWFSEPEALRSEIGEFLGVSDLSFTVGLEAPTPAPKSPELAEMIRRLAPSAAALGYEV